MPKNREIMVEWVLEALRELGGSAKILDICKKVWEFHEADIRHLDDLLYEWQYEIRWAGDLLRRQKKLRPTSLSSRGVWEIMQATS